MTRDDIIKLAREAGFGGFLEPNWDLREELERFAALVAAAERARCVKIVETYHIPVGNSAAGEMACEWTYDALEKIRDDIRAGETK